MNAIELYAKWRKAVHDHEDNPNDLTLKRMQKAQDELEGVTGPLPRILEPDEDDEPVCP
jgi:hypothetical protein